MVAKLTGWLAFLGVQCRGAARATTLATVVARTAVPRTGRVGRSRMHRCSSVLATAVLAIAPLAAIAPAPASAAPRLWRVDAARSTLTFTADLDGVAYTGRFRRFRADIVYDWNDVDMSRFDVRVDIASLTTDNRARDRNAMGPAFLDAAKFPHAFYASTLFSKTANGGVSVMGPLKLHGVVKPVTLDMAFKRQGEVAILDLYGHLAPGDFGIHPGRRSGNPAFPDRVRVHLHLLLLRPKR